MALTSRACLSVRADQGSLRQPAFLFRVPDFLLSAGQVVSVCISNCSFGGRLRRWLWWQRTRLPVQETSETWLDPWVGKISWSRKCNPLQYSCLENLMGRFSPAGYSPWGRRESDMTEHTRSRRSRPFPPHSQVLPGSAIAQFQNHFCIRYSGIPLPASLLVSCCRCNK